MKNECLALVPVLKIDHPYAVLITLGYKTVETYRHRLGIRGLAVVHAGSGMPGCCVSRYAEKLTTLKEKGLFTVDEWKLFGYFIKYPTNVSMGTVIVKDCVPVEQIRDSLSPLELALEDYDDGQYACILTDPNLCPIRIQGNGKGNQIASKGDKAMDSKMTKEEAVDILIAMAVCTGNNVWDADMYCDEYCPICIDNPDLKRHGCAELWEGKTKQAIEMLLADRKPRKE